MARDYLIYPRLPDSINSTDRGHLISDALQKAGCATFVVITVLGAPFIALLTDPENPVAAFVKSSVLGGIAALLATAIMFVNSEREAQESARRYADAEAARVTVAAREAFTAVETSVRAIDEGTKRAMEQLRKAKLEYDAHAYPLFWDHVEEAIAALSGVHWHRQAIGHRIDQFRSHINGRNHNFPDVTVLSHTITPPATLIGEIETLFRMGVRNQKCAVIWSMRARSRTLDDIKRSIGAYDA